MNKSNNKIRVSFPGYASFGVTGSMTLIETPNLKILLEAGLVQGDSVLQDWKSNTRRLPFKPREIDYIFVGHGHADHALLIPRLYAMGCNATIIAPDGTADLFREMALDSAYIIGRTAEMLSKQYNKKFNPYYTCNDVDIALSHFSEYTFDEKIKLRDDIEFRFKPSGHIINASQIELWINNGNHTAKIGYTSDLGSKLPRRFINKFEPIEQCNLLIGESTYARELHPITRKDRRNDMNKLRAVIMDTCIDHNGKVLIPTFALDRSQNMACFLYDIFGDDNSFDVPIIVDSPLSVKLFKYMLTHANEEDAQYLQRVIEWKNLHLCETTEESKTWMNSNRPCCVLSSAGMLNAGRSRKWAAKLLPNPKNHIMFCGFSVENSLATKIKHSTHKTYINIDGQRIPCKCHITDLHSFSGHMGRADLLDYYSHIQADKLAIVHGEYDYKLSFCAELQDLIYKHNNRGKVVCVNKSTEILI